MPEYGHAATTHQAQTQIQPQPEPVGHLRPEPLVVVGSTKASKRIASAQAFRGVWPDVDWTIDGISIASNYISPAMTGSVTRERARSRALLALSDPRQPLYGVGIESGVFDADGCWIMNTWVVVLNQDGVEGKVPATGIEVPMNFPRQMLTGKSLGEIHSQQPGCRDITEEEGYFWEMTGGAVNRVAVYQQAVTAALSRFFRPDVFVDGTTMGP